MVTPPPMSDEPSAEMRRVQRAIAYCFTAMPERMAQAEIICGVNVVGTLWDFSEELARAAILAMQATQPAPAMEGPFAKTQRPPKEMETSVFPPSAAPSPTPDVEQMVEALRAVEPYLDAIVCYASTIDEHDGNRVAQLVRATLGSQKKALDIQQQLDIDDTPDREEER